MIDDLIAEIAAADWRLVSLSDMSVHGLPRWWATLHRPSDSGHYAIDCKFGEGTSAHEALSIALASAPCGMSPRTRITQTKPALDILKLMENAVPSKPQPPLFTRRF